MAIIPKYVADYLKDIPTNWDDLNLQMVTQGILSERTQRYSHQNNTTYLFNNYKRLFLHLHVCNKNLCG